MIVQAKSLTGHVRNIPFLATGDSVYRAVEMLRDGGADTLPVVDSRGKLRGVVTLADLRPLIEGSGSAARASETVERGLSNPAADWMRAPCGVGRAGMSLEEARQTLARSGETTLFILDESDHYLGALTLADLLIPAATPPRPVRIGGMATPWGVYLTNGYIQAGAGNAALFGSGVMMGFMLALSTAGICLAALAAQHMTGWQVYSLARGQSDPPAGLAGLGAVALQALAFPVFLGIMRLLPLSGYHAAEHQAVHAMERNEPLLPEIVKRMPRVHPRCGTNLVAALVVFLFVAGALPTLRIGLDASDSSLIGAIAALFSWRSLGGFLQQYFTTRPANDRQIASGIAAAEELERRYLTTPLGRPTILRRIWCMGLPQMVCGASASSFATLYLFDALARHLR